MSNFQQDYIEQIFYVWFEGGRSVGNKLVSTIPTDNEGRKPSQTTIKDWVVLHGWVERADALDAEVSRSLDQLMIDKRRKMYEEAVQVANELTQKGRDFLNETGIKTDATAVRAIELGLSTKRTSVGASEAFAKISKMSDEEVAKELEKLLGKPSTNLDDIVEGTIDTESD